MTTEYLQNQNLTCFCGLTKTLLCYRWMGIKMDSIWCKRWFRKI